MEQIQEHLENTNEKIKMIEDFIALSLRRTKIDKEIRGLVVEADHVKQLMQVAHELMQTEYERAQADYEQVMKRVRQRQATVLDYVIRERRRKIKEAEEDRTKIRTALGKATKQGQPSSLVPGSATKGLAQNMERLYLNQGGAITPKITISDYKESPLAKRSVRLNPIPFVFLEFDIQVTAQQFDSIPKYMRGRETVDEFNTFLDTVLVPCFNEKYKLLHRQRSAVRHNDLEMWKLFNEQASYVPGRNFITAGDISRKINKMFDKKIQNRISMLRHIGVLQEKRVSQTVCYIWNVK